MKNLTSLRAISLLSIAMLFAACGGSGSSVGSGAVVPPTPGAPQAGLSNVNQVLWDQVDALPIEPLSDGELAALTFMREEEKLARDVYLYLYDLWGSVIFMNIAGSEQTHTDVVLHLIQKYDLPDPSSGKQEGDFLDPMLQGLYDMLIAQGTPSLMDALLVGATIEDLDIYDLHRLMTDVDNQDITLVFENLLKGSRNHMRAFSSRLADMSVVYTPVYISQDEYDSIINSPMETGP
jgi:hypothetical protein